MKPHIISALLVLALSPILPPAAPAIADNHQPAGAPPMAEAEVRKVDMDAKKITLRHGPIGNLGMPPMTMVFQVSDPAMLEKVNPGDKIRFMAEKNGGVYRVIRIEKMNPPGPY